ncbi:hypothetical protein SAMN04487859_13612 [Roseovarius lutimaris]|uniref:Uncharacterized protein n=1 Tax=Roseovarius lutimaris TaxID=1005928 RepID=A0A1I5GQF3_9RHOB|nr:hypothetical protein SAMN04487859_13612 [Roseovarius lutimaris]
MQRKFYFGRMNRMVCEMLVLKSAAICRVFQQGSVSPDCICGNRSLMMYGPQ